MTPPTSTTASSNALGTATLAGVNARRMIATPRTSELPTNTRQGSETRPSRPAGRVPPSEAVPAIVGWLSVAIDPLPGPDHDGRAGTSQPTARNGWTAAGGGATRAPGPTCSDGTPLLSRHP